MFKDLWRLLKIEPGRLWMVSFIGGLTIFVSVLEGMNVGLLIPLLENLNSSDQQGAHWISQIFADLFSAFGIPFGLKTVLLSLGIILIAINALKYLRSVLMAKTQEGFIVWIRATHMNNLLHADMSYFHRARLGAISDTLGLQAYRTGSTLGQLAEILASSGMLMAYLVAAFLITPILAAIAFGMLAIVTLSMQFYINKAKTIGADRTTRENAMQVATMETLTGINLIKSFRLESLRGGEYKFRADQVGNTLIQIAKHAGQMEAIQEVALFGLIGAIVFVGVSVLDLGLPVIVTFLFILYRLMPKVSSLNRSRQLMANAMASLRHITDAMDETSEPTIVSGETRFTGLKEEIEFEDIEFSYDGINQVLRKTNYTIEKGKMTAIAGASGAGKSTLIDLILRFYDPTGGRILIDGTDLRELDLESWRKSIAVVAQDVFLFNETVNYNLAVGNTGCSKEEIVDAAKRAYAHEFIQQLPEGYETRIGDRGWNLSGGQRQRLALARAILTKPEILILDEATSSLDSESEQLIQRYLNDIRGTCTIVVVAHRLSTIQSADKIVVLQDGKIVEEGDWDSLLSEAGVLANYQNIQANP